MDYEAEYNNRARVPEHLQFADKWAAASEAWRKAGRCEADLAYGAHERQRYDLFHAAALDAKPAAVLVYVHGGYWQWGDRKGHGWVARELNRKGVTVAVPSYRLCPVVGVMDVVADVRACVVAIWKRFGVRMAVAGHSAGGHLTAAMLATDWTLHGLPADAVPAAYAISGAFDPEPLIGTSIDDGLKLTTETARAADVNRWPAPRAGVRFVAAAGGNESSEFLRQSRDLVARWSKAGVAAEAVVVPDANHFTVVDELGRANSGMTVRIAELAHWAARG